MADQDCIAAIAVELSIGFVHKLVRRDGLPAFQLQRGCKGRSLRNDDAEGVGLWVFLHA